MQTILSGGMNMYMQRNRKYPRVYQKQQDVPIDEEHFFTLSMPMAAGVLSAVLVGGIAIGYMVRKALD